MKRARRTFSREYKLAAVKKVIEQGLSYCEVARDLGIWPVGTGATFYRLSSFNCMQALRELLYRARPSVFARFRCGSRLVACG